MAEKTRVPGPMEEAEIIRMMDAYGSALLGLCRGLLRDEHLAQDVVQDTFVKAWKAGALRMETEKAWLLRVAVNACRDVQRSRWRKIFMQSKPLEAVHLPAPKDEDGDVLAQVQQLPKREREVVMMFYWNNMSAPEIADVLSVNRATVYRRLERGQKRLKIKLEGAVE